MPLDLRNCVDDEVPLHADGFVFAWVGSPRLSKVLASTSKAPDTGLWVKMQKFCSVG
jgi:hypothetical protein